MKFGIDHLPTASPASGRGRAWLSRFMAGLMLWLFLAVLASASMPELHHALHEDADAATHECVVTQVSQSQVELLPVTLAVPVPCVAEPDAPVAPDILHVSVPPRLLSGRGPPSLV